MLNVPTVGNNRPMVAELLLRERLTDRDLDLLAQVAGGPDGGERAAARLRDEPGEIERLLALPQVFDALFRQSGGDALVLASPFVAFATLLARTPALLEGLAFVPERLGARRTVPVFEAPALRDLVDDPLRRLFLADLLASYTHVASGAIWVRSRRGWRHRRFSELDPARFAELILTVPPDQRPALYRRLGDLSLFLSGVFPDYAETHPLAPIAVERLRRALAAEQPGERGRAEHGRGEHGRRAGHGSAEPLIPDLGALAQLEAIGRRSYALSWEATLYRDLGFAPVLVYVVEHFRHARMVLNFLTDRYLFQHRERWFPLA